MLSAHVKLNWALLYNHFPEKFLENLFYESPNSQPVFSLSLASPIQILAGGATPPSLTYCHQTRSRFCHLPPSLCSYFLMPTHSCRLSPPHPPCTLRPQKQGQKPSMQETFTGFNGHLQRLPSAYPNPFPSSPWSQGLSGTSPTNPSSLCLTASPGTVRLRKDITL